MIKIFNYKKSNTVYRLQREFKKLGLECEFRLLTSNFFTKKEYYEILKMSNRGLLDLVKNVQKFENKKLEDVYAFLRENPQEAKMIAVDFEQRKFMLASDLDQLGIFVPKEKRKIFLDYKLRS